MDEKYDGKYENDEALDAVEEEDDGIITLKSNDGEEIDFVEVAGIVHDKQFYVILQPVELPEGMGDDEALVFHVSPREDGELAYDLVLDDGIIEAVFAEYNKLLDAEE